MRPFRVSLAALAAAALVSACDSPSDNGGRRDVARVDVVSGDLQAATVGTELPQPLVVRVLDDRDRPIADQLVSFVVSAGGGSVSAGAVQTDANGEARERWTLGTTAGDTQRVEARAVDAVTGEAKVFAVFRAVGAAAAASGLAAVGQTTPAAEAGGQAAVSVKVTDGYGNPVSGAQVTWVVTGGGGQVAPQAGATDASGTATAQWTLAPTVGTPQTLEARASGKVVVFQSTPTLPATAVLEKVSGDGAVLPFRENLSIAYPDTITVEARVRRQDGTPLRGVAFSVQETNAAGQPTATFPNAVSDSLGRVVVRWPATRDAGLRRLNLASGALATQFTFTRLSAPPARVVATASVPEATPGNRVSVSATVYGAQNQTLPGIPVTWTVVSGGGTLDSVTTTTNGLGQAVVFWTIGNSVGRQVVRATAGAAEDTASVVVNGDLFVLPTGTGSFSQAQTGNTVTLYADIYTQPQNVTSATVELLSQTYALTYNPSRTPENWKSPPIDLSAVPSGSYVAVFRATDSQGRVGYAERVITWTRAPAPAAAAPAPRRSQRRQ